MAPLDFSNIDSGQQRLETVATNKESPQALKNKLVKYRVTYQTEVNVQKNSLTAFQSSFKSTEAKNYLGTAAKELGSKVVDLAKEGETLKAKGIKDKKADGKELTAEELGFTNIESMKANLSAELILERTELNALRKLENLQARYTSLREADDGINKGTSLGGLSGNLGAKEMRKKMVETAITEVSTIAMTSDESTGLQKSIQDDLKSLKSDLGQDIDHGKQILKVKADIDKVSPGVTKIFAEIAKQKKPITEELYKTLLTQLEGQSKALLATYDPMDSCFNGMGGYPFIAKLEKPFYEGSYKPLSDKLQGLYKDLDGKRGDGAKEKPDDLTQANLNVASAKVEFANEDKEITTLEKELAAIQKDQASSVDRKKFDDLGSKIQAIWDKMEKTKTTYKIDEMKGSDDASIKALGQEAWNFAYYPVYKRWTQLKADNNSREKAIADFEKETINKKLAEMLPKMDASWQANINNQKKFLNAAPSDTESQEYKNHITGETTMFSYLTACEAQVNLALSKKDMLNPDNLKRFQEYQTLCKQYLDQIIANRANRKMTKAAGEEKDQDYSYKAVVGTKKVIRYVRDPLDPKGRIAEEHTENIYEDKTDTYKFTDCVEFIDPSDPKYKEINGGKGWRFKKEGLPQAIIATFTLRAGNIVTVARDEAAEESRKEKQNIISEQKLYDKTREELGESAKEYFQALDSLKKGDVDGAMKLYQQYLEKTKTFSDEDKKKHEPYIQDAQHQIEAVNKSAEFYEGLALMKAEKLDEAIPKFTLFIQKIRALPEADQKLCADQLNIAIEIVKKFNGAKLEMFDDLYKDLKFAQCVRIAQSHGSGADVLEKIKRIRANANAKAQGRELPFPKPEDTKLGDLDRKVLLPYLPLEALSESEKKDVERGYAGLNDESFLTLDRAIRKLRKDIQEGKSLGEKADGTPKTFEDVVNELKAKNESHWVPKNYPGASTYEGLDGTRKVDMAMAHLFELYDGINTTDREAREKGFVQIANHFKDEALGMQYTQKYLDKAMRYRYEEFEAKDEGATKKEVMQKMLADPAISADINKTALEMYKRQIAQANAKGGEQVPLDPPDPFMLQLLQKQLFDQRVQYQFEREMRKKMTDGGNATDGSALKLYNWSLPYDDGSGRWYKPWSWSDYNEDDWNDFKDKAKQLAIETVVTLPIGMGAGSIGKLIGRAGMKLLLEEGVSSAAIQIIERGGITALRGSGAAWEGISPALRGAIMKQWGRVGVSYAAGVVAEGSAMLLMNGIWEGLSTGRNPEFFEALEKGHWGKASMLFAESIGKVGCFRAIGGGQSRILQAGEGAGGGLGTKILTVVGSEAFSGFAGTGLEALHLLAKGQGDQITFDFWAKGVIQNALQSYGTHLAHDKVLTGDKPVAVDKKLEGKFKKAETELMGDRTYEKILQGTEGVTKLPGGAVVIDGQTIDLQKKPFSKQPKAVQELILAKAKVTEVIPLPDGGFVINGQKFDPTTTPIDKLPAPVREVVLQKAKEFKTEKLAENLKVNGVKEPADMVGLVDGQIVTADGKRVTVEDPSMLPAALQARYQELRIAEVKAKLPKLALAKSLLLQKAELEKNPEDNAIALEAVKLSLDKAAKELGTTPEKLATQIDQQLRLYSALNGIYGNEKQMYSETKTVKIPILKEDGTPLLDANNQPMHREVNLFGNYESKTYAYSKELFADLTHEKLMAEGGCKIIKLGGDELLVYHAGPDGSVQKLFIDISNMGPTNDTATNIAGGKVNLVDIYLYKIADRIKAESAAHKGQKLDPAKFNEQIAAAARELFALDRGPNGEPLPREQAEANFAKLKKEWNLDGTYEQYKTDVDSMRILAEYRADTRSLDASFKGKKGITFSEHISSEIQTMTGMTVAQLKDLIAAKPNEFKALIDARIPKSSKLKAMSADELMTEISKLDPKTSKPEDLMMLYSIMARIDTTKLAQTPILEPLASQLNKTRVEMVGEPPHARVEAPRLMDAKVVSIELPKDVMAALTKLAETNPAEAQAILTAARTLAEKPLDSLKYSSDKSKFAEFNIRDHIDIVDGKIVIKPTAKEFKAAYDINVSDPKVNNIAAIEKSIAAIKKNLEDLRAKYENGLVSKEVFDFKMQQAALEMSKLEGKLSIDPDTGAFNQGYMDVKPTKMYSFPEGPISPQYRTWNSVTTELSHAGVINSKYGYLGMDKSMSAYHKVLQAGIAAELPPGLQHFKIVRAGGGKFEIVFLDTRSVAALSKKGLTPEGLVRKIAEGKGQAEVDRILAADPAAVEYSKSDAAVRNSQFKFNKGTEQLEVGKLTVKSEKPISPAEIAAVMKDNPNASQRQLIGEALRRRPKEDVAEKPADLQPKEPKLSPAEVEKKLQALNTPEFIDGVLAVERPLSAAEQKRLEILVGNGVIEGPQLVKLLETKKIPLTKERVDDLIIEIPKHPEILSYVLTLKGFTPEQQAALARRILNSGEKTANRILQEAIEKGQIQPAHDEVLKYLLETKIGTSAVISEIVAGRFTPNKILVEHLMSSREGWQIFSDKQLGVEAKMTKEVRDSLGPQFEKQKQIYQDSDAFFREAQKAGFKQNLDKAIEMIDAGKISPDNPLAEILSRLKARDAQGYEVVKANRAEISKDFLQSVLDSNYVEIVDTGGAKVRAYYGKAVGEGGMGTVRLTAFTKGENLKLTYGVIKQPHPGKEEVFKREVAGVNEVTSWDSPYVNKALVVSDTAIILETGKGAKTFNEVAPRASEKENLAYLTQLIAGLQTYADHGAVHGDIKGGNIMIMDMGNGPQVVIIDNTPHNAAFFATGKTPPRTPKYTPEDSAFWGKVQEQPAEHMGAIDPYALGTLIEKIASMPQVAPAHREAYLKIAADCHNAEMAKDPNFLKSIQERLGKLMADANTLRPGELPVIGGDVSSTGVAPKPISSTMDGPQSEPIPLVTPKKAPKLELVFSEHPSSKIEPPTEVKTEVEPTAVATHHESRFADDGFFQTEAGKKIRIAIEAEGKPLKEVPAFIDESGRIFYNSAYFEKNYGVKLSRVGDKNVFIFEGKPYTPKEFLKTAKGKEVFAEMKGMKTHETTHRYLELLDKQTAGKLNTDLQKLFTDNAELGALLTSTGRTKSPRDIQELLAEIADGTHNAKLSAAAKKALVDSINVHAPGFTFEKVVKLETMAVAKSQAKDLTREFVDTKYRAIPPIFNLLMADGTLVEGWRVTGVYPDGSMIISGHPDATGQSQFFRVANSAELVGMIDRAAREVPARAIPEVFELNLGPNVGQFFNARVTSIGADGSLVVVCYSKHTGKEHYQKFASQDKLLAAIEHRQVAEYEGVPLGGKINFLGSKYDGATITMIKSNGDITLQLPPTLAGKPGKIVEANIYELRAEQQKSAASSDRVRGLLLESGVLLEPGTWKLASGPLKGFIIKGIQGDKVYLVDVTGTSRAFVEVGQFGYEVGGINKPVRNDTPKPISEVPRDTEVLMVGDLHGNGKIFVENMRTLKVVGAGADFSKPDTISWTGGSRKVIFHGDILADRGTDSLQIMASIRKLQAEAKAAGGEVILIAGNHEDFAIGFLTGKKVAGTDIDAFSQCMLANQGAGVVEFVQKYSSDPKLRAAKSLLEVATILGMDVLSLPNGSQILSPAGAARNGPILAKLQADLMANMRGNPEGRATLEQMSNMKLGEYINDTLFLHTDPTPQMIELINKYGSTVGEAMDNINAIFREGLRANLLGIGKEPAGYQAIKDAFTDTGNRTSGEASPYASVDVSSLKMKGVNRIIHGHSDDSANNIVKKDGVEITTVDFAAGKKGKNMDDRSIGKVAIDGSLTVGTEVGARERITEGINQKGIIGEKVPDQTYIPPYEGGKEKTYIDRPNDQYLQQIIKETLTAKHLSPDQQVVRLNEIMAKYTSSPDGAVNAAKLNGQVKLGDVISGNAAGPRHKSLLFQVLASEIGLNVTVRRGYFGSQQSSWCEVSMPNGQILIVDHSHQQSNGSPGMAYSGTIPKPIFFDLQGQPLYLTPAAAAAYQPKP